MKKTVLIILFLSIALYGEDKPYRILNSFNAGELSGLLSAREDLSKYHSGCSLMENMLPLMQGGAQKRPGTKYIAESKENTRIRLIPFEYSTEQAYIIELGNQYMRFYTDAARILTGGGSEDLSSSDNIIAHWLLNDNAANTVVADDDGDTHPGVSSANTSTIHKTGKVGTGCFDLESAYAISVTDHADFTFVEGVDGDFSIAGWVYVTDTGTEQIIMSKWDETIGSQAREWKLLLDASRKLSLCIADESLLLDSDLIAHWKLNDSAASSAVDDATGSHDGTLSDGDDNYTSDHSVDGKISNAFDFDGTNDKVAVSDDDALSFGDSAADSAFSISAWINMDDATIFPIITKTFGNNNEWIFWVDRNDKLSARLFDNDSTNWIGRKYDTAITAQEGSWIHVVATYDATEASSGITLYLNGTAVDDADDKQGNYTAMHNTARDAYIGFVAEPDNGANDNSYADGKIDNVMIFNKELSSAEVTALYNSGSGIEELDAVYPYAITDDALDTGWRFVAATYEGEHASWTGATAANYIICYIDGAAVDSTATNLSTYETMEDTAAVTRIGAQYSTAGAIEKIWSDRIDEMSIFNDVLSASEIASLYDSTSIYEISTPYLTADLFTLKYNQSADVLYITHPDYEPRKLSRLNNGDWTLNVVSIDNGPFRTENDDTTAKISASATTGSVTLTATGCAPFVSGTTAGHVPSGTSDTSKSKTGALFRLVHPVAELEYETQLEQMYSDNTTENVSWMDCGTLYKGTTWTLTTEGEWTGTFEVQRNYTIGAAHDADGWEAVLEYSSTDDRNVSTTGTEDYDAASYRIIMTDDGGAETLHVYFSTDQTDHIGMVEITSVTSPTVAIGTVLETIGSTDATHKWSEGAWSNYRGWPITVTFFEDRLVFGGNYAQPDTIWGSVTSDYDDFTSGAEDDDAIIFTLTSRLVNVIHWLVSKNRIIIGTSGAEWTLSGSSDEPVSPSNVKAEQQSSYGSADLQATFANESVLFFQREAKKLRELAYNWELDSYIAPDMTILSKEVTGDGITNIAFQQIPDSILWCVRDDGEIAAFSYERKEQITSWSRQITDGEFESVAVIHGDIEDEVWVSVKRTIDGDDVRYIEQFQPREFDGDANAFFVDCGATYNDVSEIADLDWLEGETVYILADGVIHDSKTVSNNTITLDGTYSTVQVGLPYTIQLRTMPLSWISQGTMTIQGRIKRINEVIARWYESGDFYLGKDSSHLVLFSISGQTSDEDRATFPAGYDRSGYVYIYQKSAEPLTLIALMIEFMVQ